MRTYQVQAQVSGVHNGWESSRQVSTLSIGADSTDDAVRQLANAIWGLVDYSRRHLRVLSVGVLDMWTGAYTSHKITYFPGGTCQSVVVDSRGIVTTRTWRDW